MWFFNGLQDYIFLVVNLKPLIKSYRQTFTNTKNFVFNYQGAGGQEIWTQVFKYFFSKPESILKLKFNKTVA